MGRRSFLPLKMKIFKVLAAFKLGPEGRIGKQSTTVSWVRLSYSQQQF